MHMGRTSLSDEQFHRALEQVRGFLLANQSISNSGLRALTGLNYDQGIKFFKIAVESGELERRGRASGTHYVLRRADP